MALSAVVIAAPAAHADDFLSPRQDCSKTIVQQAHRGGIVGDVFEELFEEIEDAGDVLIGSKQENENLRLPDRVMGDKIDVDVRDSFNCSNFINRSFTVDEDDRHFNHHDHGDHRDHRDHGDRDHRGYGDRDHNDRDHDRDHRDRDHDRDHRDRDHRERTAATAPTAATAATAATAPTARVARR
jgi:hypothetical protein